MAAKIERAWTFPRNHLSSGATQEGGKRNSAAVPAFQIFWTYCGTVIIHDVTDRS
jgi:hypothetical protein